MNRKSYGKNWLKSLPVFLCLILVPFYLRAGDSVFSTPPPGVVVHNSLASSHEYIGSPSICILKNGNYMVSHDCFGDLLSYTSVYVSKDKGKTWEYVSTVDSLNWCSLFTRGKYIFLIGIRPKGPSGYGDCVILRSSDGGYSWTDPKDKKSGLLRKGFYHCAPVPLVIHKGRIWRAFEDRGRVDGWGDFSSFTASVPKKADLLNAENWRFSNELKFDPGWLKDAYTWLEGNVVVAPDRSVKNILRVHYQQDNVAAMTDVSADGRKESFDPRTGFIDLPGACKKFTIRYDRKSRRYWTLSNYVLPSDRSKINERVRNTIVLAWSSDLVRWHIKETLLHVKDKARHGFQYLDWRIEGNDIIAVSRTAWEDPSGEADSQHNANYLTFHRFKDFRK